MSEVTELAEKLKSEGEKIVSIFTGLTEDQWSREVYTEGTTWTIRNVLSHFVTSERGLVKLFEQIRQGGAGSPDDFSIDRYNAAMQERTKEMHPAGIAGAIPPGARQYGCLDFQACRKATWKSPAVIHFWDRPSSAK